MSNKNRQPAGRPTGGQFAPSEHGEPDVTLPSGKPTEAISVPALEVPNYSYRGEELPAWPEGIPEPDVSFDFDDGRPQLFLTVEGLGSSSFWNNDTGEHFSSFDLDQNLWPALGEEDREAVVEYGSALMDRVDEHVYGLTIGVCTEPSVRKAILDDALGREPAPEPELTHRQRAHDRAERAIAGAGASGEPETDLADMLANLRHYADKHGLDFAELDERAYRYYSDEIGDPNFDTSY